MNLLGNILTIFVDQVQKKKCKAFLRDLNHPKEMQLKSLKKILKRTKGSEIRKKLGIDDVENFNDFYDKCPTTNYEDYRHITSSMYKEDNSNNRMGRLNCDYFVVTSGTTSEPKYIPLQNDYREEYMRIFLAWLGRIKTIRPESFSGKTMYLADVTLVGQSQTGVPCGVMSGYNFRKIPEFIRSILYCTHENFYALGDNKKKDITLLAHSMNSKLTLLGTIMPETIINFLDNFFSYGKEVIQYLETGHPPFDYPLEFKESMQLTPKKDVIKRAKELYKKGTLNSLNEFYPDLKTIICWKTSTAKFYLERIQHLIPEDVAVWDGIYSASEGWFNFPLHPDVVGGPVAINGHFIEFKEIDVENAPFLGAWELEEGKEYELFVTTSMGFFRYQMKDKVKVTGFTKKTPNIEFIEKTGVFLDYAMERITSEHVQEFVNKIISLCRLSKDKIYYTTLSPCEKQSVPHYTLIIETDYDYSDFNKVDLDQILSEINPNYGRNMKSKLLGGVKLAIIGPGFIKSELKKREEKGLSVAQFKYSFIEKDILLTQKVCPCDK